MKKWTEKIEINTSIDHLFSYFNGSLEQMQKVMPQVVENTLIKETEEKVGSIHRQKYKEGDEVQEYDVETLEYTNTASHKTLKIGFILANLFSITATYELTQLDEHRTLLTYTATNEALNEQAAAFLQGATNQVVVDFVQRVKTVAESEYQH
jgi:uncharacterized protein YecA (UPF0149 family)